MTVTELGLATDLKWERRSQTLRRIGAAGLVAIVMLALCGVFGVRSETRTARGDGVTLEVRYPHVTRAGLPASIVIEVRRPGGFDGPITLVLRASYLDLFDEQGVRPAPVSESSTADALIWEYDPPEGNVLRVSVDVIVETGRHFGQDGWVAVENESGARLAKVTFHTRIAP